MARSRVGSLRRSEIIAEASQNLTICDLSSIFGPVLLQGF
jgi:hypothetical protein